MAVTHEADVNWEAAWLVESFGRSAPTYLEGFTEEYTGTGFAYMPEWTANHMRALRFSRQEDAAWIARIMPSYERAKAVEHAWTSRKDEVF